MEYKHLKKIITGSILGVTLLASPLDTLSKRYQINNFKPTNTQTSIYQGKTFTYLLHMSKPKDTYKNLSDKVRNFNGININKNLNKNLLTRIREVEGLNGLKIIENQNNKVKNFNGTNLKNYHTNHNKITGIDGLKL